MASTDKIRRDLPTRLLCVALAVLAAMPGATETDLSDPASLRVEVSGLRSNKGQVVIALFDNDTWQLDTVLMSCRVLGRGVETAMLADAVSTLRNAGDTAVIGRYVPTDRNSMVAELFARHGFDAGAHAGEFVLPPGRTLTSPGHIEVTAR